MSTPTKTIHQRLGFHSLLVTTPPVAYVWYGGKTIHVHPISEWGEISPDEIDAFEFGREHDEVGVLLALEAINRRLEDDEEAFRVIRES